MKLVWSTEARETLQNIYDYYKESSYQSARKLYDDIINEAKRLLIFPNMAAAEPLLSGYPETYRSLVVREHYKLIYFVDEAKETIFISRIWDCRQDPAKLQIKH